MAPRSGDGSALDAEVSLSRSTLAGVKWIYTASLVGSLLQIGYTAAMGRLLTPADFGVLAVAGVFLRFGGYVARMGVGSALVQTPTMTQRKISCAFALTMGLGAAVAAIFVAIAGLARALLDDPVIIPVVRVLALGMLLGAVGMTAESLLRRELRFRRLALNQLLSFAIGYLGVGITFALLGAGVWSLVAANLCQPAINSALSIAARPHPVRAGWERSDAAQLLSFGGRVSVVSFLEFIGSSIDTFVIGRMVGSGPLGQYNRAQLLVSLPLERLVQGLHRVLFPAFSRIQSQRERVRRAYRSALSLAGALLIPTACGMSVAAVPLILVLLGEQWTTAAEIVPFLAFTVTGAFLASIGAIICEATADLNRKLVLQSAHIVVLFVLLLMAGTDLRLLAGAVAVAQLVRVVGYFSFMHRTIGTTLSEQFALLVPALGTGAAIAAAGSLWNVLLGERLPSAALLSVHILSGALLLFLSMRVGPLSSVRRDLAGWLERAADLERVPASIRRVAGLSNSV